MPTLIEAARPDSASGPIVLAVALEQIGARVTAPHRHARGQLFGAQRGLLAVGMEHSQWVVPASHAVWVPPGHEHSLRSCGDFAGWSVYVREDACADLPPHPCAQRCSDLLRAAVLRAASWVSDTRDAAQGRVSDLILDEIRAQPPEALGLPLPSDTRLLRIARALADDLSDTRRVEDWGHWAGIAPRTLSRRFIAETGFSLGEWRQRARLLRALEYLAAGATVTAVAIDLGYDNVSAFIAMFRKTLGVTPSRYFGQERD
jgi:AraC-like DNA-binding protein